MLKTEFPAVQKDGDSVWKVNHLNAMREVQGVVRGVCYS